MQMPLKDHRNIFGVAPHYGDWTDLRNSKDPHVSPIKADAQTGRPAVRILHGKRTVKRS
jgi:hypothetical protein